MAPRWQLRDRILDLARPAGVGIVNVGSDSFFQGARSETPQAAMDRGLELAEAGFDMLDVGAVEAASGVPVPEQEEHERLVPAIEGLASATGLPISADTFAAGVAARALDAGAVAINDISGAADPAVLDLAAGTGCGLVLMHIEGPPREERRPRSYEDPVRHLRDWFAARMDAALERGVREEQIALDPGLDFDLAVADNLRILRRLGELRSLERPLFVSLSRKDFLGAVLAGSWEQRLPPERREWATAGAAALVVAQGADLVRLHDPSALQSVRIAAAIAAGEGRVAAVAADGSGGANG